MTPAVEADGLRVGYNEHVVLDEVSFRVEAGQWLALLGPNGSGKTTLLRAVSGFLPATAGAVRVLGRPLHSYGTAELARVMTTVFVDLSTEFHFTVAELVSLGRTPHITGLYGREKPHDWEMMARALRWTGTEHMAERQLSRLSAGERQRAMLARALAQEPRILLLDEPTQHLDIHHQVEIMNLFDRLRHELGVTVVSAMHDLNLAAMYADQQLLLRDGKVFAAGDARHVLTEENIEAVYGCRVHIQTHPVAGVPQVMLLPG